MKRKMFIFLSVALLMTLGLASLSEAAFENSDGAPSLRMNRCGADLLKLSLPNSAFFNIEVYAVAGGNFGKGANAEYALNSIFKAADAINTLKTIVLSEVSWVLDSILQERGLTADEVTGMAISPDVIQIIKVTPPGKTANLYYEGGPMYYLLTLFTNHPGNRQVITKLRLRGLDEDPKTSPISILSIEDGYSHTGANTLTH